MPPDPQDPYTYPASTVLRNKFGTRSADKLARLEYAATVARLDEMRRWPPLGRFDLETLKRLHGHIFQDVYDWAGSIRSVDIAKAGQMFCRPGFIESEGKRLAKALAREKLLRGLGRTAFVERLADHYGDWNALHPFRDGNGRATRAFFGQLAQQAGYDLDLTRIEPDAWNEASARSFKGDTKPLRDVLAAAVRPV
ncbi:MAG: Fic family protein [Reyranella sp.]|nr:Fic family protein [Reyranella sp.]